ncbi:hypothetical protein C8R45DRAFT_999806 [Mycena sanguinolenta]|nr:hypothetical protein C8R45DRAFT_999806 [Mycena sanguinolenta]
MKLFLLPIALVAFIGSLASASSIHSVVSGTGSSTIGSLGIGGSLNKSRPQPQPFTSETLDVNDVQIQVIRTNIPPSVIPSQLKSKKFFARISAHVIAFIRGCADVAFGVLVYALCIAGGVLSGVVARQLFPPAPEHESDATDYLAENDVYPAEKNELALLR